ncbi:MAG: hypothetical protein ACYC26_15520 [Phycisphaerales bacterium]
MIGFDIKQLFFDKPAVIGKVDRATRKVLSKFGAFVRTTARHSIRPRKKPSPPGSPPSSHTGLLKKFIYFGYDPSKRSVVIGPVRLSEQGRGEAPHLLEYGGVWRIGKKVAHYSPRPFMRPAFEHEKPKLPAMWAGSIK